MRRFLTAAVVSAATVAAGCGQQAGYVPPPPALVVAPAASYYAEEVCVDPRTGLRVPDLYCGRPGGYSWDYYSAAYGGPAVVVPAVGARVPVGWTSYRPARVSVTNIRVAPARGGTVVIHR